MDTTITTTQWVLSVEALEMVKEGQNLVARRTFNELYSCVLLLLLATMFSFELLAKNILFMECLFEALPL